MSKKEKKTGLSRTEIAAELRALAADLAEGRLRLGGQHIRVGEPLHLKIKQSLDSDTAEFTLSLKMPFAKGKPPLGMPSISAAKKPEPLRLQGELGYSGRKLKKEIGRLWESVAKLIGAETMPDSEESEGLLRRCEEYDLFAGEDWQSDWATCTGLIQKCLTDAAIGDWPAAKATVVEINRMIKECHSRYKK